MPAKCLPFLCVFVATGFLVSQAASATPLHHRHHHVRHASASYPRYIPIDPENDAHGPFNGGPVPFGAGAYEGNMVGGAPPDNAFNPTRPYGGQAAITAPPGTAAFEIERQKRVEFCRYSPSRC